MTEILILQAEGRKGTGKSTGMQPKCGMLLKQPNSDSPSTYKRYDLSCSNCNIESKKCGKGRVVGIDQTNLTPPLVVYWAIE